VIAAISFVLLSIGAIRLFVSCVVPTRGAIAVMMSIVSGSCLVYILVILCVIRSISVCPLVIGFISFLLRISC